MALNPIVFTEKVVRSFLRYQLTAYPFADERLLRQMRQLLSLDETRNSPLLKGPFVSVSRPFRCGASIETLINEGIFHPHMRQRIPSEISHVYGHQEDAIRAIHGGKTTLVSTGTGSGKSECFLYPIVSKCLKLRDENAAPGISAVIVYPMNSLAEDQLGRLRSLLAGTGISFGMYVGKTPEKSTDVAGIRLPRGASRADYQAKLDAVRAERRSDTVYPPEEVCSREEMRRPGGQPRILLTNIKQLELLLTRQRDVELFSGARLDYLVFDEAHTFTGAQGAETACLIRRLRAFCGRPTQDTVCVATSATIVDKENPEAAREFASRFFGVPSKEVTTVGEAYEREAWAKTRKVPPAPKDDPAKLLAAAVDAVEDASGVQVRSVYQGLAGKPLPDGDWTAALYKELSGNEIAWQLAELLTTPTALANLPDLLEKRVARKVSEAEVLAWLTLGAAARDGNRPLLRPVVHAFIRGISGAVVTFPSKATELKLWLAAEDELRESGEGGRHAHFGVTTCTTCGQHYFIHFLKDFHFTHRQPEGGEAAGDSSFWPPLEEAQGGKRVIFVDKIIGDVSDDGEDSELDLHDRTALLQVCRCCGAAHPSPSKNCLNCGTPTKMVTLYAIQQKEDNPGNLTSCLSCGATGRRIGSNYREPARQVRATNVADVHVLSQDMVHNSERQRLLVFCDNRQDAAFQAGWMKDHARRFRLRSLMAQGLKTGPLSVGDLARFLDDLLERNESLSRALVPEVWLVQRKEGDGGRHAIERRKFLRIQVLREVTLSARQAIGLEPWGRMRIDYQGLDVGLPWIQRTSAELGISPEELCTGVASVLDYFRRKQVLFDREWEIFSKWWQDGDQEIEQGYLPKPKSPKATKLRREAHEKAERVAQWYSERGETPLKQIAKKWGVDNDHTDDFLKALFGFLVDIKLLCPVTLKGSRGNPLPDVSEVYQVDADRLRLQSNHGVWRCRSCRRRMIRTTPHNLCPAWRCDGVLESISEDADSYDLQLLDQEYSMLRPEEHTAMVPHEERERLENLFKGDSDAINTFVCTPTLELGVDIGQLDAVLMRNVPPLPANYWQRAGRAGRRHRMAVNITYCRPVSHDRAYFSDPLRLLAGRVDPPAFNLRNGVMVGKHVRATVITRLQQYTRELARNQADRKFIEDVLKTCLPDRISSYLFDNEILRTEPFDLMPLRQAIEDNMDDLCLYVDGVFRQGWPAQDIEVATQEGIRSHISTFVEELNHVIIRLNRRLKWALDQILRLNEKRKALGTLDNEDNAHFKRCDALVKRLKGISNRARRDAEGYDDVNTFGVLAAEGFLPGYGLEVGAVLGTAEIPYWRTGAMAFSLPRASSVALREYVPGNLIYANGNRFVARRFHLDAGEIDAEMPLFDVDITRQAVRQTNTTGATTSLASHALQAIPVCDVELAHQSHISDDEELRFQLPVAVFGLNREQHSGGRALGWGEQPVHLYRGNRFRLVNVGATRAIMRSNKFGYPVCAVCGQSVSPLSSDAQLRQFSESHMERCGRAVLPLGFYADVVADALTLPNCTDHGTAYSVLEALRMGAAQVLDMTLEDLQILVIGHVDRTDVDAFLWDPMPGGSGLLDQICARFTEIIAAAKVIVDGCPSDCGAACIDCLQTFRNGFYHKYLDRKLVTEKLTSWGEKLVLAHEIPAKLPSQPAAEGGQPVNEAERRLQTLLMRAGFEEGTRGKQLRLDRAIGTTTPDVIYRAHHHDDNEGVCIYLDGLSKHLHGNPATAERDRLIRSWLRNHGYEVIEISANELTDQAAMTRHFRKLAGYLHDTNHRDRIASNTAWFSDSVVRPAQTEESLLTLVRPKPEERYVNCLPLIPLKAAAGSFGEPQNIPDDSEWENWVTVDIGRKLRRGMFVAKVVGKSMEPKIPDGSYCVFSAPVAGARQGKIVLVQLLNERDPESGERYTVKRYESEKSLDSDGTWRHKKITLHPLNASFQPIHLTVEDEGSVAVIAEFIQCI